MNWKIASGAVLLLFSVLLFFLNEDNFSSWLPLLLASLGLLTSILSGRKLAYLQHDAGVVKRRGSGSMPARAMALVFSLWLLFLILYTIFSILLLKMGTNLIIASLKGTYWNLGMMLVAIVGAYLLFAGISFRNPEKLYTRWGKMAGKGVEMTQIPGGIYSKTKNMLEDEFARGKRKSL